MGSGHADGVESNFENRVVTGPGKQLGLSTDRIFLMTVVWFVKLGLSTGAGACP